MIVKLERFPLIKSSNLNKSAGEFSYNLNYKESFKSKKDSLLFPPKAKLNFWSYEGNLAKKNRGKLVELIFFGLNYNAKRIKYYRKPYVLDLQKSHKIKVDESRISEIKTKIFKRRILFWSYDRGELTELVNLLKKQRPQNSYSGHGLLEKTDNYSTKPGKIRQK